MGVIWRNNHWSPGEVNKHRYSGAVYEIDTCMCVGVIYADNPRYVEVNAGCKHFDVHGGPENIPVSRFSFNSVVRLK